MILSKMIFQVEKLEHDAQQQHAELMHLRDNRQSVIASTIREKDDEVKQIEFLYKKFIYF